MAEYNNNHSDGDHSPQVVSRPRRSYSQVVGHNIERNGDSRHSTPQQRRRALTSEELALEHAFNFPPLRAANMRRGSQPSISNSTRSGYSSAGSLQEIADVFECSFSSASSNGNFSRPVPTPANLPPPPDYSERTGPVPPFAQRPSQPSPPPPPPASVNPGVGVDQHCHCDVQFTTTTINTLIDLMKLLTGEERCDTDKLIDALRKQLQSRGVSSANAIISKIQNLRSTQQRLSQCPRPAPDGPISVRRMREPQNFPTIHERESYVNAYRDIIEGSPLMEILIDYGLSADDLTKHRKDLMQNVYAYLRNLATRQERQMQMDQERHRYNEIIENQQQEIDQLRNDNRNVIQQLQRALRLGLNSRSTFVNGSGDGRR